MNSYFESKVNYYYYYYFKSEDNNCVCVLLKPGFLLTWCIHNFCLGSITGSFTTVTVIFPLCLRTYALKLNYLLLSKAWLRIDGEDKRSILHFRFGKICLQRYERFSSSTILDLLSLEQWSLVHHPDFTNL